MQKVFIFRDSRAKRGHLFPKVTYFRIRSHFWIVLGDIPSWLYFQKQVPFSRSRLQTVKWKFGLLANNVYSSKFKILLAVTNLLIGPILKLQIIFIFKSIQHCEQPSINNNKIDQLYKNTLLPNFEKYKSAQYAPCLSSGR